MKSIVNRLHDFVKKHIAKGGGICYTNSERKGIKMENMELFLKNLQGEGKSKNTIVNYQKDVRDMLSFVNKNEDIITVEDLVVWKASLDTYASASVYRKISAVKSYFGFLNGINRIKNNPAKNLKNVKVKNKEKPYIPMEEAVDLIKHGKNARDKAIVAMYLSTGLRVSELIRITLEQYKNDDIYIETKGGSFRRVYLNQSCREYVDKYLETRKNGAENLFVSNQGTPMRPECINRTLKNIAKRAGITKNISNHSLRYTFVSDVCDNYGIRVAQETIGHKSIKTTERYSKVKEEKIKDVMLSIAF